MRKLVVLTFLTLDGVMQAPGGPEEDPSGEFHYGGWTVGLFDETLGEVMDEQMRRPIALLLGRKTYEIFAAYWPYADTHNDPVASVLNAAKKYVASRTLEAVDWDNSELIREDVASAVRQLKQQDGPEIQVHGSGNLIQTLMRHDLIDEYRLKIFPITLGVGKRLFAGGAIPAGFTLLQGKILPTGVIVADYARAGEVTIGTFATEPPSEAELARRGNLDEEARKA